MTGTLYERRNSTTLELPNADEAHLVPSGYWKAVAMQHGTEIKVAAFVFDQGAQRGANFCDRDFAANVRWVEIRTNLDFFHGLSSEAQDVLETNPSDLREKLGCEQ
jgi:endonuclease G